METCKCFVYTEEKSEFLFYNAGLYWIHICSYILSPEDYWGMVEKKMIGEEWEKKTEDSEIF